MSHLMTKPTKWHVWSAKTQISLDIRPVWSECLLSAWRKLGSLATHWVHSEDWSDWAIPRLIWVFAGHTVILLVLSWGGSNIKEAQQVSHISKNLQLILLISMGIRFSAKSIKSKSLEILPQTYLAYIVDFGRTMDKLCIDLLGKVWNNLFVCVSFLCFQFIRIFDSFMNKEGIRCLKFYYQDSVMPPLEGTNWKIVFT